MAGFNPVQDPALQSMTGQVGQQYTQALQATPQQQFQLPTEQLSQQFGQTLSGLGNTDVQGLAQTAFDFYKPEIERAGQLAQAQRNREFGSRGFGSSSSKVLADIEGQRLQQEQLGRAQERAFMNAYQLAPQLQQAQTQQLGQLADIGFAPQQQDLQRLTTLGGQYAQMQGLGQSQQGINIDADRLQQQLQMAREAQAAQQAQQAAALGFRQEELGQAQSQFDINAALKQQQINNDLLRAQLAAQTQQAVAGAATPSQTDFSANFGG